MTAQERRRRRRWTDDDKARLGGRGEWLAGGSCKRYKPVFQRLCCCDLFSVAEGSGEGEEQEEHLYTTKMMFVWRFILLQGKKIGGNREAALQPVVLNNVVCGSIGQQQGIRGRRRR